MEYIGRQRLHGGKGSTAEADDDSKEDLEMHCEMYVERLTRS